MIRIDRVRTLAASSRLAAPKAPDGVAAPRCHKVGHATKGDALNAARHLKGSRRDRLAGAKAIDVYHCHRCDAWHIGHRTEGSTDPKFVHRKKSKKG